MGRKTAKLRATASLSDHRDDQDEADRKAWKSFLFEVRQLASRPEYAEIDVTVWDDGTS